MTARQPPGYLLLMVFLAFLAWCGCPEQASATHASYEFEAKGDLKGAILAMKELVERSQTRFYSHMLRLGYLHMQLGDYDEALHFYQEAEAISPSLDSEQGMLTALIELERWNEAERTAALILEKDPDNYLATLRMGYIAAKQEKYDKAVAFYDRILDAVPNNQDALTGKAYALMGKGEREKAREWFRYMLMRDPGSMAAQQGLQASKNFKFGWSQYYTQIFYSPRAIRKSGLEANVAPTINYRDRLIFTPAYTYNKIDFGQFGATYQSTINLGLLAYLTPRYALNVHVGQVYNNHLAANSTKDGKIAFVEAQYLGKVFVGIGGAYSDYNADSNVGIYQGTLRVGYRPLPWLVGESKFWYSTSQGPLRPTGVGFQRQALAFEQLLAWSPESIPGLTLAGAAWFGRKLLPIEANGAQIWNLTDLLMGGYRADILYAFKNGTSVFMSGGIVRAKPTDVTTPQGNIEGIAYQQYMLTGGYSIPLP